MKHHLEVLKNLDSNKEIIKYCKTHLKQLGNGSARMVFALSDTLVIKVAKGKKIGKQNIGILQNQNEIRVWSLVDYTFESYKRSFARVHIDKGHWNDLFIVMERLDTKGQIPKINFKVFEAYRTGNRKTMNPKIRTLFNHVSTIDDVAFTNNLSDMSSRNIGLSKRGVIKILDYGFSDTVWKAMMKG